MTDQGLSYEELATLNNISNGVFSSAGKFDFSSAIVGKGIKKNTFDMVDSCDLYRVIIDQTETSEAIKPISLLKAKDNSVDEERPLEGKEVRSSEGWTVLEIKCSSPTAKSHKQAVKAVEAATEPPPLPLTLWKNEFTLSNRNYLGLLVSNRVKEFIDLLNELSAGDEEVLQEEPNEVQ